ncbi:hypothetical protein NDU88_003128 [Pleurodeles waltl]|uniref:L1 transposable element RRM domain-containing protein n=1 Tax=Pleurodeles waltl TaxID=8319 RepID=A0AAV7WTT6_PLEWA|nr:hypothetical protein NDU88_003128 [Pleurodeles waltl]
MQKIPEQIKEVDQRVSDLKDRSLAWDKDIDSIKKKLLTSKNKIDEMENYARRLNLHFLGIPEEAENVGRGRNSPLQFMEALNKTHILESTPVDLTIMRAHRVPAQGISNAKYPRTIIVSFADYRIKEDILTKAIQKRFFLLLDKTQILVFFDMSAAAAHQRRDFIRLVNSKQLERGFNNPVI